MEQWAGLAVYITSYGFEVVPVEKLYTNYFNFSVSEDKGQQ